MEHERPCLKRRHRVSRHTTQHHEVYGDNSPVAPQTPGPSFVRIGRLPETTEDRLNPSGSDQLHEQLHDLH
jgi:hypothetical protein